MQLDANVQTNNDIDTLVGVEAGACFAMTLEWIKASKRYGGITRTWQIGDVGKFRILQARYDLEDTAHDRAMIERAGLTIQEEYNDITTFVTVGQSGYHVITTEGGGGGHATGSWVNHQDGKYQYFDPQYGLYRAVSAMQLISDVAVHVKTMHRGYNASHTIYKVA